MKSNLLTMTDKKPKPNMRTVLQSIKMTASLCRDWRTWNPRTSDGPERISPRSRLLSAASIRSLQFHCWTLITSFISSAVRNISSGVQLCGYPMLSLQRESERGSCAGSVAQTVACRMLLQTQRLQKRPQTANKPAPLYSFPLLFGKYQLLAPLQGLPVKIRQALSRPHQSRI